MSLSLDPTLRDLNDCGCCDGITAETPMLVFNRPGLSAVAYRIGQHATFKASMLAALSAADNAQLQALKTRAADDFSIALLDAWSTTLDVLTFYQERIANESYLGTATERLSVLHLARLLGYELRPGVASGASLAFTLDETAGSPETVTLDPGLKVQSIPGPGEQPQIFETIERIEARPRWNAIPAAPHCATDPLRGDEHTLAGRHRCQPAARRPPADRRSKDRRRVRGGAAPGQERRQG